MINATLLNSYLGKPIEEICLNGFISHKENHCAHFVSHVLDLDFGRTCTYLTRHQKKKGKTAGANVSVKEIFDRCAQVYEVFEFNSCPAVVTGLIFVSAEKNFLSKPSAFLGTVAPAPANPLTLMGTNQPQICKPATFVGTVKGPKKKATMRSGVKKKHIGIIYNGQIWHYSNALGKVVVQTMAQFINHYPKQQNALWFGGIPAEANPHPWLTCVKA